MSSNRNKQGLSRAESKVQPVHNKRDSLRHSRRRQDARIGHLAAQAHAHAVFGIEAIDHRWASQHTDDDYESNRRCPDRERKRFFRSGFGQFVLQDDCGSPPC